jgi:hypothetical protein
MLSPVGLQTRPLSPAILGLAAREQLVKTTTELIIADAVRRWTNEVMPNEPAAAAGRGRCRGRSGRALLQRWRLGR